MLLSLAPIVEGYVPYGSVRLYGSVLGPEPNMFRCLSAARKGVVFASVSGITALNQSHCEAVISKKEFKAFKLQEIKKLVRHLEYLYRT